MKKQKLTLTKDGDLYKADFVNQPGSPSIGLGDTPLEAIVFLLCENEEIDIEFIDETNEVLNEKGAFPNGYNARRQGR
jgi:hypothetical protein